MSHSGKKKKSRSGRSDKPAADGSMKVRLTAEAARNLRPQAGQTSAHAIATILHSRRKRKTNTPDSPSLDPTWGETFDLYVDNDQWMVQIDVVDVGADGESKEFLGRVDLDLESLCDGKTHDKYFPLAEKASSANKVSGEIRLIIFAEYAADSAVTSSAQASAAAPPAETAPPAREEPRREAPRDAGKQAPARQTSQQQQQQQQQQQARPASGGGGSSFVESAIAVEEASARLLDAHNRGEDDQAIKAKSAQLSRVVSQLLTRASTSGESTAALRSAMNISELASEVLRAKDWSKALPVHEKLVAEVDQFRSKVSGSAAAPAQEKPAQSSSSAAGAGRGERSSRNEDAARRAEAAAKRQADERRAAAAAAQRQRDEDEARHREAEKRARQQQQQQQQQQAQRERDQRARAAAERDAALKAQREREAVEARAQEARRQQAEAETAPATPGKAETATSSEAAAANAGREGGNAAPSAPEKPVITLTIDTTFEDFVNAAFKNDLAELAGISFHRIRVLEMRSGSVVYDFNVRKSVLAEPTPGEVASFLQSSFVKAGGNLEVGDYTVTGVAVDGVATDPAPPQPEAAYTIVQGEPVIYPGSPTSPARALNVSGGPHAGPQMAFGAPGYGPPSPLLMMDPRSLGRSRRRRRTRKPHRRHRSSRRRRRGPGPSAAFYPSDPLTMAAIANGAIPPPPPPHGRYTMEAPRRSRRHTSHRHSSHRHRHRSRQHRSRHPRSAYGPPGYMPYGVPMGPQYFPAAAGPANYSAYGPGAVGMGGTNYGGTFGPAGSNPWGTYSGQVYQQNNAGGVTNTGAAPATTTTTTTNAAAAN